MPALISTRALTKRYPGGVTALDGLSLEIGEGVIGLVGANGAGKSTLLKILLGLLPATDGGASVLDFDTATQGDRIRELVGYMPEHDCLPPDLSATEFVAHMARVSGLPAGAARERTADVLRHVGLYEERYRQIGGYSTGMKQRVKLAQALVHDPRVLFLDEPTNGLDPAGRDEMLELVQRIGRDFGITVIVASHLLGEIERIAGWLVAIDAGRLLRTAPLSTFTERTGKLLVETEEGAAPLAARLVARGMEAVGEGRIVVVDIASAGDGEYAVYDAVRDEAVELGMALVRIEHRRHQLEDLFRPPASGGADERVA
jgi:ABC-2 type transport system ATP-binding protein